MRKSFVPSFSAKKPVKGLRLAPQKKISGFFLLITEWLTLLSAVFVLFAYFPFVSQSLELPKQAILLCLVGLAGLCWLGAMLLDKTFLFRKTLANPIIIVLLAAVAVSTLVSSARYIGLVGEGGEEYQSLLSTFFFALLFVLVLNVPERRSFARRAMFVLIVSGGFISLLSLLKFAGVLVLPFADSQTFNLIGSTVVLGFFSAVIVSASSVYFLIDEYGKYALARRIVVGVCGLLSLLLVQAIGFWPILMTIVVGVLPVLVFAIVKPQSIKRLSWLAVPMGVLMVCVLFMLVKIPAVVSAPVEVFPSFSQSWQVAKNALVSHPVFGSGPGTYAQAFSMYRGEELNQSSLWYLQFDRGLSYLLTTLVTAGLAGLVAWLAVLAVGIWRVAVFFLKGEKRDPQKWLEGIMVAVAWLSSAFGLVFYGVSFATLFVFWLLLALLVRVTTSEETEVRLDRSPRAALTLTFSFIVLLVIVLAGWFITGTRFYASVMYFKAVNRSFETQLDPVIAELEISSKIDRYSAPAVRALAQAYLIKLDRVMNDSSLDRDKKLESVQTLSSAAIKAGQAATGLVPEDAQNWAQLGEVYEAMISYVDKAGDEAVKAYEKAAELAPSSPIHPTSLGRVYLAMGNDAASRSLSSKDSASRGSLEDKANDYFFKAESQIKRAIKLKPDYDPANYQLALVMGAQGKTKEAIVQLQAVELKNPTDIGVAFKLAVFFNRDGQKDRAVSELERAISLSPEYADARWLLATIYEEQSKWDEAIAQVNEILKILPDNVTVKEKLKVLMDEKAGENTSPED